MQYHDQRTELLLPVQQQEKKNGHLLWTVQRNEEQEARWMNELLDSGLESYADYQILAPDDSPLEWVIDKLPKLVESGYAIYGEKLLKRFARPKKMTSSSFSVQSGEKWFELEGDITFGDTTVNLMDIHSILMPGNLLSGFRTEVPAN